MLKSEKYNELYGYVATWNCQQIPTLYETWEQVCFPNVVSFARSGHLAIII